MSNSTWEQRDLPVLRAIVELTDEGAWHIDPQDIAERLDINADTVMTSLGALAAEEPAFFRYHDVTALGETRRVIGHIHEPTGHARRTVGTWPTPESQVDRLIQALVVAANHESDNEKSSALRRVAAYLADAGREIAIGVISGSITG